MKQLFLNEKKLAMSHSSKCPPKKGLAKLSLVVSNPNPISVTSPCQKVFPVSLATTPIERFSVETRNKGHHLYEMIIQDPSHYLSCTLDLEVEEYCDREEGIADGTVICYFPPIDDSLLNTFIEMDEVLYGMIMVQFQMKVLEQLFLFCAAHYTSQLIIYMNDEQAEKFGIYDDFLSHDGKTLTLKGEKTELVLPANYQTFDKWIDFMDKTSRGFRQSLWKDKASNFTIRSYLKWDPSLAFFY